MERIATVRQSAVTEVYTRVAYLLTDQRREEVDRLLVVEEGMHTSRLAWFHRGATSASPMSIRAELDKLRYLRDLDAHALDLSARVMGEHGLGQHRGDYLRGLWLSGSQEN